MIVKPATFRELIKELGGVQAVAGALSVPDNTAKKMRDRNSIAIEHWQAVIAAGKAQGLILTTDDLVNMKLRQQLGEAA